MTAAMDAGMAELGTIEGPVLVFGGPVSNLQATEAVLARARELDIPAGQVICTGDVVAYCGDPAGTVDAVRRAGIHVVMGNCEEALGAGLDDCGCNFTAGSACDLLSRAWYAHAERCLPAEARAWMRDLPRQLRLTLAGRRLAVVHGAASEISRWIFASTPAAEKRRELALAGADGVIGGHSGLPFAETVDGRLWLNAGSIGLPANDGTPRGWYALLTPRADGIEVGLHALAYDHEAAAARMRAVGLPNAYAATLVSGIWPSWDMLPPAERTRAGRALPHPWHMTWAGQAAGVRT